MKCPTCDEVLLMSEKAGIEIDYCPKCRGVWLDRGELDKIIERSAADPSASIVDNRNDTRSHNSRDYDDRHRYPNQRRKKKSFLDDIFDF